MIRFNSEDRRIIRIALSHYAYSNFHNPKQDYADLVKAARLIARMECRAGDKRYIDAINPKLRS